MPELPAPLPLMRENSGDGVISPVAEVALAPDLVLPQRDTLLDPMEMARRLSPQMGGPVAIAGCERLRVKYHVGASLRVLYRVHMDRGAVMIAARTFPPQRNRQMDWGETQPASGSAPFPPVFRDAGLNTTFWTFPNDRKIRSLGLLTTVPRNLSRLLSSVWTQSCMVAYAPEKCATAQCLSDRGEILAYAKVYADNGGWCCYRSCGVLRQTLAPDSPLRIPRAIAYFHPHRLVLLQPIPGWRVADLTDAELGDGLHGLGAAVACLHALPVAGHLPRFTRLDVDRLQRAAEILALARPDVARLAHELGRQLASRLPCGDRVVCLHGDVHPKNGILTGDRTALIDLDQLATGPAAADLGSMLAALHYERCVGLISPAAQDRLAEAFLGGYRQVRELPDAASLRWHTAAALLGERALRAVSRIRPEGLQFLGEILNRSQNILLGERP